MLFSRNLYEEIVSGKRRKKRSLRWLAAPLLWCAVPGALLLAFRLCRGQQSWMNALTGQFTTPLKHLLSRLCAHLPFALAEVLWAAAIVLAAAFLVRTVWLLVRRGDRLRRLLRRGLAAMAATLIVACGYTLMWGANYYADSFQQRSGLSGRGCTAEELGQLTAAFADACNELSGQVDRDGDGLTQLNTAALFDTAAAEYQNLFEEFSFLKGPVFDPKPMVFSRFISMIGFTGFYFPMTAESLVNVDQPDCMIPATILHELSHQQGVAEEDACNFLAILAGLRSDDPAFQYSSALSGYIYLGNALAAADPSRWQAVRSTLNSAVLADLEDNSAYWAQFDSPLEDVSESVYTGFLESYGQTEGMASYGQCVDLLVAYYFDN